MARSELQGNKRVSDNAVMLLLLIEEDLALSGMVSKEAIDFLTCKIRKTEDTVVDKIELKKPFAGLRTIPGIGKILSLLLARAVSQ